MLDNENDFINGICLRYYYNNVNKIYYSIEDEMNFKYPYLTQKNKNNTKSMYLNTIIEKCNNNSISTKILGNCANENEIDEYLNTYKGIYLNLLEHQVNIDNYLEPIIQYINHIYTEISNTYSSGTQVNNINFSPLNIEIQKSFFFPQTKKIKTYSFKNNIKSNIYQSSNKNVISIFNYKILNKCNVFQGKYSTLYDILPSVGGIIQLIYYLLFCFNYIFDKYTTIQDSENLFFRFDDINGKKAIENKKKFKQIVLSARNSFVNPKNSDIFSLKSIRKNISNKNIHNDVNSINEISSIKKALKIPESNEITEFDLSNEQKSKVSFAPCSSSNLKIKINKDRGINDINRKIIINKNKNSTTVNKNDKHLQKFSLFKKNAQSKKVTTKTTINYRLFTKQFSRFLSNKKTNIKHEILSESYLKKNTSFFYYLTTFLGQISERSKPFYIINKFRKKLLSEEHFFKSHVYSYYLEKYFGIVKSGKIDITELYNYL